MSEDSVRIEEIRAQDAVTPPEADDPNKYTDEAAPKSPNSALIKISKSGFVSWQSDNPITVLALIMLVLVLFVLLFCSIISAFRPDDAGVYEAVKTLGQAVLILVGVVGGSAASGASKR